MLKLGAESWGHSVGDLLGELEKKYEVTNAQYRKLIKQTDCNREKYDYRL